MVTINASTSAGLVMTSDLSGVLTLQQNGVALPNGGVAPAFSAYQSTAQTLSASTTTKIQFQTEEFDTANCFDSTTNYRFTPTVAGYYQVNSFIYCGNVTGQFSLFLYKNGGNYKRLQIGPANAGGASAGGGAIVYLNGTTDYIEIYGNQGSATSQTITFALSDLVYFQACLVRGA